LKTLNKKKYEKDIMNLDDSTKNALQISVINELDLVFTGKKNYKELTFFNYKDGDIQIGIEDEHNNTFIVSKEQIDIMLAWIKQSRGK
jgi:hypothetical protein